MRNGGFPYQASFISSGFRPASGETGTAIPSSPVPDTPTTRDRLARILETCRGSGPRRRSDVPNGRTEKATGEMEGWSGRPDLNWGPLGPEPSALPGYATPRKPDVRVPGVSGERWRYA